MELKIKTLPVSEENYAETMKTKVEPYLAGIRADGHFASFDGKDIHYEKYVIPNAVGTVVLVHGFTESAEKFREMAYNYLMMDLNAFVIDNRGHGLSYRKHPENPETVCVDRFEEYVEDLKAFVDKIVKPAVPKDLPLYLYCHSMGGAIGVQFLQTYPGVFTKAVLSAPMIEPMSKPLNVPITKAIMRVFCAFGQKDKMVFIHHGFDPDRGWEDSHDTSKARFEYYHEKRKANRNLQTAGASCAWVREAMKVVKKNLDPKRNARITLPVLLCQPETDTSVVSEKENVFVGQLKNARLVQFPNSKHEIYLSVDSTMLTYLQTIEKFLKED